jgi:hypothetical protein
VCRCVFSQPDSETFWEAVLSETSHRSVPEDVIDFTVLKSIHETTRKFILTMEIISDGEREIRDKTLTFYAYLFYYHDSHYTKLLSPLCFTIQFLILCFLLNPNNFKYRYL